MALTHLQIENFRHSVERQNMTANVPVHIQKYLPVSLETRAKFSKECVQGSAYFMTSAD